MVSGLANGSSKSFSVAWTNNCVLPCRTDHTQCWMRRTYGVRKEDCPTFRGRAHRPASLLWMSLPRPVPDDTESPSHVAWHAPLRTSRRTILPNSASSRTVAEWNLILEIGPHRDIAEQWTATPHIGNPSPTGDRTCASFCGDSWTDAKKRSRLDVSSTLISSSHSV